MGQEKLRNGLVTPPTLSQCPNTVSTIIFIRFISYTTKRVPYVAVVRCGTYFYMCKVGEENEEPRLMYSHLCWNIHQRR